MATTYKQLVEGATVRLGNFTTVYNKSISGKTATVVGKSASGGTHEIEVSVDGVKSHWRNGHFYIHVRNIKEILSV